MGKQEASTGRLVLESVLVTTRLYCLPPSLKFRVDAFGRVRGTSWKQGE